MPVIYKKAPIEYFDKPVKRCTEPKKKKYKLRLNYKNFAIYVIPTALFSAGAFILGSQIIPTAKFYLEQKFSTKYQEIASPVPDTYYETNELAISGQFEAQYFSDLFENLNKSRDSQIAGAQAPYMTDWQGTFTISIPSVGIKDMKVNANTDSYDKAVYGEVLKKSVAHFKGTDLPANNEYPFDTNTFIYGHSAPSNWAAIHTNSFDAAFNPLFNLNIGDKIIIKFLGEELTYSVKKIKITKPEDMSTLQGIKGKKTVTLMTCAPPGSSTNRLNIIATLD